MSLFNQSREINQDAYYLTHKIFRGIVIDNNDPLKIGRIRARVDGIHTSDKNIPWSMSALNTTCASNVGGINIPEIGSQVWVLFCSDDLYSTLYFGASYSSDILPSQEFLEDYPNCRGWTDSAGNLFIFNQTKGFVRVQLISGASFTFDNNGLTINTNNIGPGVNDPGLNVTIQGDSNITTTQNLNIKAKNINIEATESISVKANNSITYNTQAYKIDTTNYILTSEANSQKATSFFDIESTGTGTLAAGTLDIGGGSVSCQGLQFMSCTVTDTNMATVINWGFNCFGGATIETSPVQTPIVPSADSPMSPDVDKNMPEPPEQRQPNPITVKPNINNFV